MSGFRAIKFGRQTATILITLLFCSGLNQSTLAGEGAPLVSNEAPAGTDDSNAAKNLARMNCGAKIEWVAPDGRIAEVPNANDKDASVSALIMDDDTLSYPLPAGDTTFIITLPRTSLLDRFTFLNENAAAEGQMKIFVSNYRLPAESSKWTDVNGTVPFTHKRLFNLSLVGVEARYVKLSFHVEKGGRIAALGLYGAESLQKFAARSRGITRVSNRTATRRIEDMLNFNFANLYAKARVVYVSSGLEESARRMIDDDTVTAFQFAPSDPHPTAIVELAETERLHRVSALFKMQPGRLDVYLLKQLASDPGDLSGARPIATAGDTNASGKAAVEFDPQGARYVGLRWTPLDANATRSGFEVAEIHAFGDMPLSMLNTYEVPEVYASNATALSLPGAPVSTPLVPLLSE
ncbi:MAG: hypothetical protein QOH88_2473 [Verrucomicrobiota bacterium]|jgi:hypothetical protein